MDTIFLLLFLVVAAIIANLIHYRLTRIPVAFLQIGMGLLLALLPVYHNFHLEPEVFMFAPSLQFKCNTLATRPKRP
ncbi:hypothetical protein CNR29_11745 [Levilactobacillus brevis]|uniref:Na+/H+ antiporter n=1 Tax=Levilactobacillus brevis TaxID=1580 RepID=A0A2A3TZX2_LEVBR|nr:hypothetical protein [Levilactobacillus brevis]PBQ24654.1 hypothetical protein CNR29_11745 [Levilactobacillus brevis]